MTLKGKQHKAMADQIATVFKKRLDRLAGRLSVTDITAVDRALRVQLAL